MKKRITLILSVLLVITLLITSISYADNAEKAYQVKYTIYAEKLAEIGVLKGSGSGFELNRSANRAEAAVILVRLLGAEAEALEKKYEHPFTDVPEWADNYVGYLYHEKLFYGTSKTTFSPSKYIDNNIYCRLILNALGYSTKDDPILFSPYEFAFNNKIINQQEYEELTTGMFLRDDMVMFSYIALNSKLKNSEKTLIEKLGEIGAIDKDKAYNISINIKEQTANEENYKIISFRPSESVIWDGEKYISISGPNISYSYDGIAWITKRSPILSPVSLAFNGKEYVMIGNLIKLEPQDAVSDINKFNVDSAAYDLKSFVFPVTNSSNGLDYEVTSGKISSIQHRYYILDGYKLFWNGQKYVTIFVDTFLNEDFALISNDGKTFTKHSISINDPRKLFSKTNLRKDYVRSFNNIIFDRKSFFALYNTGIGTSVVKSNDGIEWDIVWFDKINDVTFGEVIYGGDSYFLMTRDNLYSSNDGYKWIAKQSKLFSAIKSNGLEKNRYDIRYLYNNGTFYLQLIDASSSHWGKGQNKIYITKDMDNYTCLEINHDIGEILYVNDNIVITTGEVMTIKK